MFLSATIAMVLGRLGIPVHMPRVEDNESYPALARMTMGFSIDELLQLQRLVQVAREISFDEERAAEEEPAALAVEGPESQVAEAREEEENFAIEVVARQAWRLEAAHPNAFAPEALLPPDTDPDGGDTGDDAIG